MILQLPWFVNKIKDGDDPTGDLMTHGPPPKYVTEVMGNRSEQVYTLLMEAQVSKIH